MTRLTFGPGSRTPPATHVFGESELLTARRPYRPRSQNANGPGVEASWLSRRDAPSRTGTGRPTSLQVTGHRLGAFAHDDVRHSTTLFHVGQVRLDALQCDAKVIQPRPVALQKLDGVGDLLGGSVQRRYCLRRSWRP